jgi:hypothetical protein
MPTIPFKRPLSAAAKAARSAAVPFPNTPEGADARQLLVGLRQQLDAIARDSRSSLAERDAAGRRVLTEFQCRWQLVEVKAAALHADVLHAARVVGERVRAVESELTPLDLMRIERQAMRLAQMSAEAREDDFNRAFSARDWAAVAAHGVDGDGAGTRRAIAAATAPEQFQHVVLDGGRSTAFLAAAKAVAAGLTELVATTDAHVELPASGIDLMRAANSGVHALASAEDLDRLVPADTVPAWLRGHLLPPRMAASTTTPAPDQAAPGGAA